MRSFPLTYIVILFLCLFTLSACADSAEESSEEQESLQIAAASNLTLAFKEIAHLFEEETGINITYSFGSTGQLAEQIENGAPFDIFVAANPLFLKDLQEKEAIISESTIDFAYGKIGIATATSGNFSITDLEDLLDPSIKKIAIANPAHAPFGTAAEQALKNTGLLERIDEKLVYARNIADTLSYLESGNVEAAIISESLYQEGDVEFQLIDSTLYEPIEQTAAIVTQSEKQELASSFLSFLEGSIGKEVLKSYGFDIPEEDKDDGS